jgi:hypothetical protein
MNIMHLDIYCTTSITYRSKLSKHSVFTDSSQEISSSIYILSLKHLFLESERENADILFEQLAQSVLQVTCTIYVSF